jgi:Protein of unknown function (DUF3551)
MAQAAANRPKEAPMRVLALSALATVTLLAASSASAQTYGPGYPVCLHVYGPATYYECNYSSIAQCNASAAGRGAQCEINPYAANAAMDYPPLRARHPRRAYWTGLYGDRSSALMPGRRLQNSGRKLMRVTALAAIACGLMFAALPAPAQTYDPAYPVCKKVNGDPTYFDCRYATMPECKQDVRAMSAECVGNPYYKGAHETAARSSRGRWSPEEEIMQKMTLAMLGLAALLSSAAVSAQTYGGSTYPVCLQIFGLNSNIDCSYVSIEQCRPVAAARAAQCIANPSYVGRAGTPSSRRHKHRAYWGGATGV